MINATIDGTIYSGITKIIMGGKSIILEIADEETKNLAKAISIDSEEITIVMNIGDTVTLKATVYPPDINSIITWVSSNVSTATVLDGVITAVSGGTCTVKALSDECASVVSVKVNTSEIINNLYVADETTNTYFYKSNGEYSNNGITTGFIPVRNGYVYDTNIYQKCTCFYDKDKNIITSSVDAFTYGDYMNGVERLNSLTATMRLPDVIKYVKLSHSGTVDSPYVMESNFC